MKLYDATAAKKAESIDPCPDRCAKGNAAGSFYYMVAQLGQKPADPVLSRSINEPVAALGRLELISEAVSVSVSTTLNNDRVKQLLVKRSDRAD